MRRNIVIQCSQNHIYIAPAMEWTCGRCGASAKRIGIGPHQPIAIGRNGFAKAIPNSGPHRYSNHADSHRRRRRQQNQNGRQWQETPRIRSRFGSARLIYIYIYSSNALEERALGCGAAVETTGIGPYQHVAIVVAHRHHGQQMRTGWTNIQPTINR